MKEKLQCYLYSILKIHSIDVELKKEIYKDCIKRLEKKDYAKLCLCSMFREHIGEFKMHLDFPEVYLQKPSHLKTYRKGLWFDIYNRQARIKILKKALKKLGE